ncbi:hypothetical protein Droror1_Dr00027502 [Drosera rotundifolia]
MCVSGSSNCSAELLWMVSRISSLAGAKASCLARVMVASGYKRTAEDSDEDELTLLDDLEKFLFNLHVLKVQLSDRRLLASITERLDFVVHVSKEMKAMRVCLDSIRA